MADNFLNLTGLTRFKNKIIALIPTKTSDLTNDDNVVKDVSYVHTDNNYTTTEKNKLNGIASGAEVNVIEEIKVNNSSQTITNKSVNISVPSNIDNYNLYIGGVKIIWYEQ